MPKALTMKALVSADLLVGTAEDDVVVAGWRRAATCSFSHGLDHVRPWRWPSMPGVEVGGHVHRIDAVAADEVGDLGHGLALDEVARPGSRPCGVTMRSESSASKVRSSCGRRTRMSSSSVASSGR